MLFELPEERFINTIKKIIIMQDTLMQTTFIYWKKIAVQRILAYTSINGPEFKFSSVHLDCCYIPSV